MSNRCAHLRSQSPILQRQIISDDTHRTKSRDSLGKNLNMAVHMTRLCYEKAIFNVCNCLPATKYVPNASSIQMLVCVPLLDICAIRLDCKMIRALLDHILVERKENKQFHLCNHQTRPKGYR